MKSTARSEESLVGSLVAIVFMLFIAYAFYDSIGPAIDQLLDQRLLEASRIIK